MPNQATEITNKTHCDNYQHIHAEKLQLAVVSQQILSGSRIVGSEYQQVAFSHCQFYACEFQAVTFENCIFEDCEFEFAHFRNCKFINCNFNNCSWKSSSLHHNYLRGCELGSQLPELLMGRANQLLPLTPPNELSEVLVDYLIAC